MGFRSGLTLLCLSLLALASTSPALGQDDNENSTPTAWWIYTGQSVNDVNAILKKDNARIINIKEDPSSHTFTTTYVQNTGSYAKQWWWYYNIDAKTLEQNLKTNNARLISLQAFDAGGGNLHFTVAMVANTGADAKQWWWYYGKSTTDITNLTKTNNARLTSLESYSFGGQTVYAVIMIANTGKDAKSWWWYYNQSPQAITSEFTNNKARLLDVTSAGGGNFNVVMEGCTSNCPGWWWWYGLTGNGVLDKAQNDGARVLTADTYQGCNNGSNQCIATVMISDVPADITACDNQGCISEAKLVSNICNKLANKVVGYACLVGGVRPIFGGQARTNSSPPTLAMAPDLVTDIASVSKTMTAVAIVQLLAQNHLLDTTKISGYLYSDWKQGPYVNTLTFKELLTHTSGFGQINDCGDNSKIDYAGIQNRVANGVTQSNIGKPAYGNCNFALLRELMPALLGQRLNNISDPTQRAKKSSEMYRDYMNSHVFQPVSVPHSECTPPAGNGYILSYTAGGTSGTDWGDWSLRCGSGGWVLSAGQIFRVVNDLATGSTLLNSTERNQMFSQNLGWDSAVRSDCPNPFVCKNGDLNNGTGTQFVWTYAGVLKCNVPVVVVVNSPLPAPYQGGEDIIGLVKDAFNASTVPGTGKACQ
jgi:CubicO group peptidase (beta-lactamase class C family)